MKIQTGVQKNGPTLTTNFEFVIDIVESKVPNFIISGSKNSKKYIVTVTENDLIDILTTNFNNSSNGQCSSNKIITQAQNLYIGKDFKDVGKINFPND
jgi:hypothetical protein